MVGPTATLNPLVRSDGSASFTCPSTRANILSSVNAPVELPGRRDALRPEDTTLEVFVKPGTTPAGVGERYVEGILRNMLGRLILGREKGFPRRGVVLTLAVVGGQDSKRGDSYLTILPSLLHASLLALLSASVPLSMTFAATVVSVTASGKVIREPSSKDAEAAKSLHVLAFSSKGHLLLNESEGVFDFDTWERVYERALNICQGAKPNTTRDGGGDDDVAMIEDVDGQPVQEFLREVVEDRIYRDYSWEINAD